MLYMLGLIALVCFAGWAFWANRSHHHDGDEFAMFLSYARPGSIVAIIIWTIANSIVTVSTGAIGVPTLFGSVKEGLYQEGMGPVNPFYSVTDMTLKRRTVEFHSEGLRQNADPNKKTLSDVTVTSREDLPLTMDVAFPYALNAQFAARLFQRVGDDAHYESQLVRQAAASAMRSAARQFLSHDAVSDTDNRFAIALAQEFSKSLIADLEKQGFTHEEAAKVFTIAPVKMGKVLPPERVLVAIAEKEAALQDKDRQQTLTDIAAIEAKRRENEGMGVANLMAQLPKGYTSDEISKILTALASKEKADAMMKAVTLGKVSVVVMDGGSTYSAMPLAAPIAATPPAK